MFDVTTQNRCTQNCGRRFKIHYITAQCLQMFKTTDSLNETRFSDLYTFHFAKSNIDINKTDYVRVT